jgi:hypothetical protein
MIRTYGVRLLRYLRYVPMLRKLTEYVFALCDLLEAEGRALRQAIRRAAVGIGILLLAGLLLATGLGFLIAGVFLALAVALNAWAGALITGGIVLALGAVVAWFAIQTTR